MRENVIDNPAIRSRQRAVAIVPARGGSKGIPRKNLLPFCGQPLLVWTVAQALEADTVEEVYVSSDSQEILDLARSAGATPVPRPSELAGDSASSESALRHTLEILDQDGRGPVSTVVFLQATSPLRLPEHIDGAVALFRESRCDCVFSAAEFEDLCVWQRDDMALRCLTYDPSERRPRQDSPLTLVENGSIYVLNAEMVRSARDRLSGSYKAYSMPSWSIFEIDEPTDIAVCEVLMRSFVLGADR